MTVTRAFGWKDLPDFDKKAPTQDPIVNNVIGKFITRSDEGMVKYKQSMAANPLSLVEWLNHLQEELMDACNYIERAMVEIKNNAN